MPIFLSVKVLLSVLRWQISKQKKQMPSMLEYDLLYGSETRPILSVGFFFFHKTWDCPGDEVEPHPAQIGPPQVFNSISFFEHPRHSQPPHPPPPPPPLHHHHRHHPHPGMFKGLLTTVRYTSSVSEHLYRSHPPPPGC